MTIFVLSSRCGRYLRVSADYGAQIDNEACISMLRDNIWHTVTSNAYASPLFLCADPLHRQ